MTPDPAGMAAADPANPQSWNRYAYVMNNPLNATDPFGLYCYFGDGATIGVSGPRDIGEECGSGALDSSDPGGPVGFAKPNPRDQSKLKKAIWQLVYSEWIFQQLVNSTWHPHSTHFTVGIKAPGQTWSQCMNANANTYSFGGSLELGINVATGTSTNFSEKTSAVTGNQITGLIFEGPGAGDFLRAASHGAGSPLTFGRRTSDIMSLNLAGKGGLPQALEATGAKDFLESLGKGLNLGLDEAEKGAIDVGLAGAEAANCAIPR